MLYIEQLEKAGFENPYDTCLNIHTRNFDFTLAFIEFEDEEIMSILVTDESGREKLKIVNKEFIEYIEVIYADDIDFVERKPSDERMFG